MRDSAARMADHPCMFTVYAIDIETGNDTEAECASLNEALTHLRELAHDQSGDDSALGCLIAEPHSGQRLCSFRSR